jgi:glycosyltransferase involved in cell wall biosynthesis
VNVAVIIAAYRAQGWIVDCLKSVRTSAAITDAALDIRIGVDNCGLTAIDLAAYDEPYHWSPVNVGPYVIRNSLIALAPADAFVIFDADDVMLLNYFNIVLSALRTHALVGPSRIECDEHLTRIEPKPYRHGVCAFRAGVLSTLGGYRAERLGADVDFIARARMAGIVPYVTPEPCYLRRRHGASLTHAADTAKGSAAREAARRRMERQRMGGQGVYVEPVTTPLVRMPEAMSA